MDLHPNPAAAGSDMSTSTGRQRQRSHDSRAVRGGCMGQRQATASPRAVRQSAAEPPPAPRGARASRDARTCDGAGRPVVLVFRGGAKRNVAQPTRQECRCGVHAWCGRHGSELEPGAASCRATGCSRFHCRYTGVFIAGWSSSLHWFICFRIAAVIRFKVWDPNFSPFLSYQPVIHTTFQSHHLQFQPKSKLYAELNTAFVFLATTTPLFSSW